MPSKEKQSSTTPGVIFTIAVFIIAGALYVNIVSTKNNKRVFCPVKYDPRTQQTVLGTGISRLWVTNGRDTSSPPPDNITGVVAGLGVSVSIVGGYKLTTREGNIVDVSLNGNTLFTAFGSAIVVGKTNPSINEQISQNKGGVFLGGGEPDITKYGKGNPIWNIISQMVLYSSDGEYKLIEEVVGANIRGLRLRSPTNEVVLTGDRLISGPSVTLSAITRKPYVNVYDKQVVVQTLERQVPSCLPIPNSQTSDSSGIITIAGFKSPANPSAYRPIDVLYQNIFKFNTCYAGSELPNYLYTPEGQQQPFADSVTRDKFILERTFYQAGSAYFVFCESSTTIDSTKVNGVRYEIHYFRDDACTTDKIEGRWDSIGTGVAEEIINHVTCTTNEWNEYISA